MASSISLTRATITITTTTSTLFSKLLRCTHSRSMAAPYTSRSFFTNAPNFDDPTQDHFKTDVKIQSLIEKGRAILAQVKEAVTNDNISSELLEVFYWHPFQREGPKCPYQTNVDRYNFYARIDMPGVGKDGVKVWMDKEDLFFKGEVVEKNPENGNMDFVREFSGSIYLHPRGYDTDNVKCVVRNGVVRIVVPRRVNLGDIGTFSPVKVEFC